MEHRGKNNGGPNQWIIRVRITPRLQNSTSPPSLRVATSTELYSIFPTLLVYKNIPVNINRGSHDSTVQELTVCPPCGPGSIPGHGGVCQWILPWLITLCQPVLSQCGKKWLNLPSMTPYNLWPARRKANVQPW